jgi:hypothetical protein
LSQASKVKESAVESDKLDQIKWQAQMSVNSYGVRFGIRINNNERYQRVLSALPPGWKASTSRNVQRQYSILIGERKINSRSRPMHRIYCGGEKLSESRDLTLLLDGLESDIQLFVAEYAPRRVFIHAGVVAWQGKAIIIPGRSYSGKTTLTREFVRAGAAYYSDEYAVLDSNGLVHPYPRPLGIRETAAFVQTKHTIESLGGKAGKKPLPVGIVIVSKFKQGAKWRPQRLSAGQGTLELLANAVAIRRAPEMTLAALQPIVSNALIFKGNRGEAKYVVDSILSNWN